MIKTIFFDFDGVLTLDRTGNAVISKYLSVKTNIPKEIISKSWKEAYGNLDETGGSLEDAWQMLCGLLKVNLPISEIYGVFASVRMDERTLSLVEKLRKKYKVGLITDNNRERFEFIDKKAGITPCFDFITVSCYVHATKSSPKIFEDALRKCGNKPQECIFIDNNQKNLDTAKAMGFTTILYDTSDHDFEYLLGKLKEAQVNVE